VTEQRPYTFDRVVRILLSVGILAGTIWLAGYLSDVLIPFAIALPVTYLLLVYYRRLIQTAPSTERSSKSQNKTE
jgi:predicted PurR-regulated permease PerM